MNGVSLLKMLYNEYSLVSMQIITTWTIHRLQKAMYIQRLTNCADRSDLAKRFSLDHGLTHTAQSPKMDATREKKDGKAYNKMAENSGN